MAKHLLEYTLKKRYKRKNQSIFLLEAFKSKKDLRKFLQLNEKKMYWFRVRKVAAKSKLPKAFAQFEITKKQFSTKEGHLDIYFETGMECQGLVLIEENKKGYDSLHFIRDMDILEIDSKKYWILHDPKFAEDDGDILSLYPCGFSIKEIATLFSSKTKAKLHKYKKLEKK